VALVELQPALATMAAENLADNGLASRGQVHVGDLAEGLGRVAAELVGRADLVVANPPYVAEQRDGGRAAHNPSRAIARTGALAPFLDAASAALGVRGRACFVYPAASLTELLDGLRARRLEPKRLRLVHGRVGRPARVALVEACRGRPGGLVIESPLVEVQGDGRRASEVDELLSAARTEQPVEGDRTGRAHAEMVVAGARRAVDRREAHVGRGEHRGREAPARPEQDQRRA
jgi:tRNA1Val (adenine37-N6)-methyltransferase